MKIDMLHASLLLCIMERMCCKSMDGIRLFDYINSKVRFSFSLNKKMEKSDTGEMVKFI